MTGSTGYVYLHLDHNIHTAGDLSTLPDRPPALVPPPPTTSTSGGSAPAPSTSSSAPQGPPINILLLGSQTRDGQSGQFGGSDSTGSFGGSGGTDLSDTSMLLHISGDRKHAIVVSIPRDTLVDRPTCPARDGKGTIPGQQRAMFDASMSLGGPLCAAETVEQYFHVRVDHFVRLDFNGFRKIVSYLGGVEVCIPAGGINDPLSHLDLPAGRQLVTGDEALAFVRDRHGLAGGSDLARIEMQKMFLTSLITKIEDAGTLNDVGQLYQLADITTSSITTDDALGSVTALLDLAGQVQDIKPHDIDFVTMPTVQDQFDPNRVDPAPDAEALWALIRSDQALDGASTAAASPTATPTPTPPPTATGTTPSPTSGGPTLTGTPSQGSSPQGSSAQGSSATAPSSGIATDLQDRPADADICSNLPAPNPYAADGS
ncbi:LCP family protein [Catenulispora rubra]|uniref:LCP family protein n=1 Tax=Catenulispora rubra TaxID=280293 RepID=UPI00189274A3|nr:LCP family protein [Catenulispora rubra]